MRPETAPQHARRYLARVQDASGGWGYQANQSAFVEPTALCLLALTDGEQVDALQAGQAWLQQTQLADGSWGVSQADPEGSWATAWAIWALASITTTHVDALERGIAWWDAWQPWVGEPGQERDPVLWIDPTATGWPWSAGGTSWVEPTALGIIALVTAGRQESPRVIEGVRYLLDRSCANGGWNVGNPYMLEQSLPSAIPQTALGLMALQDAGVPPAEGVVSTGLATLDTLIQQARTPLNLAWGLWAMRRYHRRSEALETRLQALQAPDGSWRDSPYLTALAKLALAETVATT